MYDDEFDERELQIFLVHCMSKKESDLARDKLPIICKFIKRRNAFDFYIKSQSKLFDGLVEWGNMNNAYITAVHTKESRL